MVQCCVPQCKNRSDCQNWKRINNVDHNRKITFHSFPKNDSTRKLWMDILGLPAYISNTARICSDHFPSVAFDINSLRTRLKPDVLPCTKIIPKKEREEEDAVATCCKNKYLCHNHQHQTKQQWHNHLWKIKQQ